MKFIASVSFGKDSLAMLLLILEHKLPLDEVVFFDTGMEFEAIYNNEKKVIKILKQNGIKYTKLSLEKPFEDYMYNYPHEARNGSIKQGYGWCGGLCRWCTSFKTRIINRYLKNVDHIQYVGIAIDESKRLERLVGTNKISPLAAFNMSEADALGYCYERGFNWLENGIELYSILDRVSCWCCRNKNLKELANYKKFLPGYFERLVRLEKLIGEPMKKPNYLTVRFKG